MSLTGLDTIDRTLHKTNEWLAGIMKDLRTDDRKLAYTALRSVLHALRDRLALTAVVSFGAQLPLLVRGIYYDGWRPDGKPLHARTVEEFLTLVERDFPRGSQLDTEAAARAVFATIAQHLDPNETEKIVHALPKPIQELWQGEEGPRDS